ncbi:hypothetical protein BIV60_16745 [Bacillus sp. MUM 116]|nr:hypothetical protein BIV60_16745 [Bacillus sp. MUM 116]
MSTVKCAHFFDNVEKEDINKQLIAYVKDGFLNKDLYLESIFSIKNTALITNVDMADNKRISIIKIYPPTLKFSVKNNTVIIFNFLNQFYSLKCFKH